LDAKSLAPVDGERKWQIPVTRNEINLKLLISGANLLGCVRFRTVRWILLQAEQKFSTACKLDRTLLPQKASAWFSEYFLARNYVSGFR